MVISSCDNGVITLWSSESSPRLLAAPLVAPGIDHQENENHQAEEQEDYCPGLAFPELLEAPGDFVEIHAKAILPRFPAKRKGIVAGIGIGPALRSRRKNYLKESSRTGLGDSSDST